MSGLNHNRRTILIGIGNDGRSDDALGWLFADRFAESSDLEVIYRYQLQVEDAELISAYDCVIFVDASVQEMETGFCFQQCRPAASVHFSTHKIDPATILWLTKEIYQASVQGYIFAIQGYEWALKQQLSEKAAQHFQQALLYFEQDILPAIAAGVEQIMTPSERI
ncbi:MAG: hydrogenase maturation protease [Lewinellaceae bacterium]|jgi:hydrogenase maturation protease|nr:hydrogenase maturation protease [Lewinellaceae bacterium]